MTLVGKRDFADLIKLGILRCDHPGLAGGPKPNDKCPYNKQK